MLHDWKLHLKHLKYPLMLIHGTFLATEEMKMQILTSKSWNRNLVILFTWKKMFKSEQVVLLSLKNYLEEIDMCIKFNRCSIRILWIITVIQLNMIECFERNNLIEFYNSLRNYPRLFEAKIKRYKSQFSMYYIMKMIMVIRISFEQI